jgi:rSAM-partnered protein
MTNSKRMRVTEPRSDTTPEWEVFLRADRSDPLRHVGSVSAPSAAVARKQADSLFGWTAHTLWICRTEDVVRFTDRDLSEERASDGSAGEESSSKGEANSSEGEANSSETDGSRTSESAVDDVATDDETAVAGNAEGFSR